MFSDESLHPTALRLLDVAERLFADEGVVQVSLQRIVADSGQRNRSALNYHFGNRERLLAAVMNRRWRAVDAERHAWMDRLPQREPASAATLVRSDFACLAGLIRGREWGGRLMRIWVQTQLHPHFDAVLGPDSGPVSSSARVRALLVARLGLAGLTPAAALRLDMARDSAFFRLARWSRQDLDSEQAAFELEQMIDFGIAAVEALAA